MEPRARACPLMMSDKRASRSRTGLQVLSHTERYLLAAHMGPV